MDYTVPEFRLAIAGEGLQEGLNMSVGSPLMRTFTLHVIAAALGLFWSAVASAENFVMPYAGQVYLEATTAKTGADWKFGTGTTSGDCHIHLSSLPDTTPPKGESPAGFFNAGETIRFCMWSEYGPSTAMAFSDGTDPASRIAFGDMSNALHMGGQIIEQTGASTWLMHLDNAVSYLYDDSNDDVLIQIRIDPAVPPTQSTSGPAVKPPPVPPPNHEVQITGKKDKTIKIRVVESQASDRYSSYTTPGTNAQSNTSCSGGVTGTATTVPTLPGLPTTTNVNGTTNSSCSTTTTPATPPTTHTIAIRQEHVLAVMPDGRHVTLWCQAGFRRCADLSEGTYTAEVDGNTLYVYLLDLSSKPLKVKYRHVGGW